MMFIARQNLYRWIALVLCALSLFTVFSEIEFSKNIYTVIPILSYFAAEVLSITKRQSLINLAVILLTLPTFMVLVLSALTVFGLVLGGLTNFIDHLGITFGSFGILVWSVLIIAWIPLLCAFVLAQLTKRFILPKIFKPKTTQ